MHMYKDGVDIVFIDHPCFQAAVGRALH